MFAQTKLDAALSEIEWARNIAEFSTAVVSHDKQLRMTEQAVFLQKAAAEFQRRFMTCFEETIRARKSWGYATTCNAVSRRAGGQPGMEACERIAAQLSRFDDTLIRKVGIRALSIFASSFGRHPRRAECRNGAIRIAKFCRDESRSLRELNNLSLAALVNGFCKWPEEAAFREATLAIAGEITSRAGGRGRLADFTQQGMANLVNGFCKWPGEPALCQAAVVLAREVQRRAAQLPEFAPKDCPSW